MSELTYSTIIRLAKLGFRVLGQQITVTGLEHLPRTGGALVAVNHIGYVDFVYAGIPIDKIGRRPRFMAKRELFDHRLTGPIMRPAATSRSTAPTANARWPSRRSSSTAARSSASSPRPPSPGRWRSRTSRPARPGSPHAADVPLLPLVLWGTQRLMTKDHDRDLSRGTAITVSVGAPVPLTGDAVADTAALRTAMSGLLDDAIRSYPQHEPGRLVAPGVVRRQRPDARGSGADRRRGEGRPGRPQGRARRGLAAADHVRERGHGAIDVTLARVRREAQPTGARSLQAEVAVGEAGAVAAGPRLDAALVQGGREPAGIGAR